MSATGDRAAGTIKETAGKLTGDTDTEARGKGQKVAGKVEGKAVNAKKKVEGAMEKLTGKPRR